MHRPGLGREALAQALGRRRHLAVHDALVLELLRVRLQPLPGQRAPDEVHQYITQGLQIVPSRLFDADVRVDRRVARRPRHVLVLAVGDVLVAPRISIFFSEPEIDDVDHMLSFPEPDQEVVRLHVAVDEALRVDVFQPRNELVRQHQHRLEVELPSTVIEQIFE